jgi:predicted Rossmann fold flavoprotein
MSQTAPIVVVGGGAAGLMAAIWAARGGAPVVLLEGSKACGLKILVSGGGHCNVLPSTSDPDDFFTTGSRNVLNRLFRTWRLPDIQDFFENDLGIPLVVEEKTGKLFPASRSARSVRNDLVAAAERAGVVVHVNHRVTGIERKGPGFVVRGERAGRPVDLEASSVVMATGGLSLPKTGSDGAGYDFVRGLGHSTTDLYPALVPLRSPDEELRALTGLSVPVRWRAMQGNKVLEARERDLLFTHRGFSGPAILDASHWCVREKAELRVAFGAISADEWTRRCTAESRKRCDVLMAELIPRRLAELLLDRANIPRHRRFEQLNPKQTRRLLALLCDFSLPVSGDEGYAKAEVTGGGVPLGEVDPSTLESRKCPDLFLCGEIFDVIGRMGGFNFLWAWVTGRLAGESAAARYRAPREA